MEDAQPAPPQTKKKPKWIWFASLLLWGTTVVFAAVILSQVAMWSGVTWLRGQSGQEFLKAQIETALKDSGYQAKVSGLNYTFPSGFIVEAFDVSDADGVFASGEDVTLHVSLSSMLSKGLKASLSAEKIAVIRAPKSTEKAENKDKQVIALKWPVPYFTSVAYSVDIDDLSLPQDGVISVQPYSIAFSGGAQKTSTEISVFTKGSIEQGAENYHLDLLAKIGESIPALNLERFLLDSSQYGQAEGEGVFTMEDGKDSRITLRIDHKLSDALAPIDLILSGHAQDAGFEGDAKISGLYQDHDLTLDTKIEVKDQVVSFSKINGQAGADITLSGDVTYDMKDHYALGKITADVKSLEGFKNLIPDVAGRGQADIEFLHDAAQGISLKAKAQDVNYDQYKIGMLDLDLTLPDVSDFLNIQGDLAVKNAVLAGQVIHDATFQAKRLDANLFDMTLNVNGVYEKPYTVKASSKVKTAAQIENSVVQDLNAKLSIGKNSSLQVKGDAALSALNLDLIATALHVSDAPVVLPAMMSDVVLSGKSALRGTTAAPIIDGDIKAKVSGKLPLTLTLKPRYEDGKISLDLKGNGQAVSALDGNFTSAMKLSLYPFALDIPKDSPLNGAIKGQVKSEFLASYFLSPEHHVKGGLGFDIGVSGGLQNPEFAGDVTFENGSYENKSSGLRLMDIAASAHVTPSRVEIQKFSARDEKEGRMTGSGTIALDKGALSDISMTMRAEKIQALDGKTAKGTLSADVKINGNADKVTVTGVIEPERIEITIPQQFSSSIPTLNTVKASDLKKKKTVKSQSAQKIVLDMTVDAPRRIFVRGWGLDAEFGGKIHVGGDLSAPLFDGKMSVVRGRYVEFGKRFEITKADMNFSGTIPPTPSFDIVTESKAGDVMAQVNIKGSVVKPEFSFSSVPALPEDEVLARILFGEDVQNISPMQAAQLAQTARRFSGQGGGPSFDPLGAVRGATGLDDLRVETDDNGAATVGAGKYLTDNVYLEFQGGAGENSGAATLEIEVTPEISIESEIGQDAQGGAGVFWNWDY